MTKSDAENLFSYHDNKVQFQSKLHSDAPITGGLATVKELYITSGQDPKKLNSINDTKPLTDGNFIFRVGRKGSEDAADWFSKKVTVKQTTFGHNPGKLNFAFLVDLTLKIGGTDFAGTYSFPNVMLAQGRAGSSNNWWFGGQNADKLDNPAYTVACKGTKDDGRSAAFHFSRGGAPWVGQDVNQVWITQMYVSG